MRTAISAIAALCLACSVQAQTPQFHKGWPSEADAAFLRENFVNPPKGYGNVPFYWLTGDELDLQRLSEQLDILAEASTDGLCISYNHTDYKVDVDYNADGHGPCGRVSGGKPRIFSGEWWDIWNEFSGMCADKGIGMGLDDYVVAWPGNREYMDSIRFLPGLKDYQGRLKMKKQSLSDELPQTTLATYEHGDEVTVVYTEASPELHPDFGRHLVEDYFQQFEDRMDTKGRKGMNYFFQDELQYDLNLLSWSEDMPSQFQRRKGYDIAPYLPLLFAQKDSEVDQEAARVRLDYAEVLTQLAEERFFKPVFDWNADRGLIYGCDNEGRGLDPLKYLDYFRAVSWFTAPGNDAPSRGSSFRQTKVSSSIAHLYGRPRTWLEAFHSMGWDANGGVLTRQLDHHLIAGGNLLCLHGLYYSTHGGWWEWAPPCFHFRMPYWPHMKTWLKYAERMCYLLSQGTHVCDIAVLYSTETQQAFPEASPDMMFNVSTELSEHGLDYDFIDYQSLQRASIEDACIKVAGESYRILVLPAVRAMHSETASAVQAFKDEGGIVIYVDDEVGVNSLVPSVNACITPDFSTSSGEGKVLHRRIGGNEVYMVMDVQEGDVMTFRASGKAEKWDAMHGTMTPLAVKSSDGRTTDIVYEGATGNSMLVVFSEGEPLLSSGDVAKSEPDRVMPVDGLWDIETVPTMDNRWGDFRLPASDGMIGVEAREMTCDGVTSVYGYAPYMKTVTLDGTVDLDAYLAGGVDTGLWEPYPFSWQYGVFGNPGGQGYHGLKSKVDDRFLILAAGGHQLFATNVHASAAGRYDIVSKGVEPYRILIDGEAASGSVELAAGWHELVVAYASTQKSDFDFSESRSSTRDPRDRGMVMLYPEGASGPHPHDMYDGIVASSWYGTDFAPFVAERREGQSVFEFPTAPGARSLSLDVNGTVDEVRVDGRRIRSVNCLGPGKYTVEFNGRPSAGTVRLVGTPDAFCPGTAFFREPVGIVCEGGKLPAGDWTGAGAMKFYSGGVRYSKDVRIPANAGRVVLDLGEVDATCEVSVNGRKVDVLLSSPYRLDITDYVRSGRNHLEVLVYSSLANHYQTIPTPYKGTAHAGLIGPVTIAVWR